MQRTKLSKKVIIATALIMVAASSLAFAFWTITKPVENSIIIVGAYGFELFSDPACTVPFSGTISYGEVVRLDTWINGPRIFGKNVGDVPIIVTWNTTTFPTGIVQKIFDPYSGNPEWIQNEQQTWQSGYSQCMQLDLEMNLAGHELGTFTWTTVFYAKQT